MLRVGDFAVGNGPLSIGTEVLLITPESEKAVKCLMEKLYVT